MAAVGDDDKARVFDDMVRRERLRRVRYRVASEASKRMDETLEAPESVSAWSYVLAWSVVVALQLFFCYYLISTGSKFGLRKSRVWLSLTCRGRVDEALQLACTPSPRPTFTVNQLFSSHRFLELATFFLVVKPLFVASCLVWKSTRRHAIEGGCRHDNSARSRRED